MPLSAYFSGHGEQVMHRLKRRYGPKAGERIFYATAKKRGQEPQSLGGRLRGMK